MFGLEEANVAHLERATYVEQLRGELGAINEQKQQSEARLKDEMDRSFNTVEELRELLDTKIDNLEERANVHQGEIQVTTDKKGECSWTSHPTPHVVFSARDAMRKTFFTTKRNKCYFGAMFFLSFKVFPLQAVKTYWCTMII